MQGSILDKRYEYTASLVFLFDREGYLSLTSKSLNIKFTALLL